MKAKVSMGGSSTAVLYLTPETPAEKVELEDLMEMATRGCLFSDMQFEYLQPEFKFYICKSSGGRD